MQLFDNQDQMTIKQQKAECLSIAEKHNVRAGELLAEGKISLAHTRRCVAKNWQKEAEKFDKYLCTSCGEELSLMGMCKNCLHFGI